MCDLFVFPRRVGDARFTYLDAADINQQINRQDCGSVLGPVQFIEIMAEKLMEKFRRLLQNSDKYFARKYLHILLLCLGMNSYSNEDYNDVVQSYAHACVDLGGRTEEAMKRLEHQVKIKLISQF